VARDNLQFAKEAQMNISRFRLFLVTAVTLLTLTSVTTVFAAKPFVETFRNEGSFVAADCGTFLALEDFVEDVTVTTFFDNAGNPIRVQVHVNFNGIITNSVTGQTLRDPGHHTIIIDLEEGTTTFAGMVFAITVPGKGIAVLDAGKVVFDAEVNVIFVGGPHQFLEEGPALICAALD
jgi:hypothetical protein